MSDSQADRAEMIRAFIRRNRFAFELLEESSPIAPATVIEKDSGKRLSFPLASAIRVEEDRDAIRGNRYLRVSLEDGRNFALTATGLVFAPSFVSSGELPDCPPAAGFADFGKLFTHLEHLIGEVDQGRQAEALQVILILIAFLDGARAIGLEVGPEEAALEAQLKRLEERGVSVR